MKKILVTGGTGFVGSHLCHKLHSLGHEVICVDNNYTGSLANIQSLNGQDRFRFIEHDIINPLSVNQKVDEIYNLASPASPVHYQGKAALFTTKTCVYGSFNMLDLALNNNAKILQASTSEVYGEPLVHPQVESYRGNVNPIGIRACYDEGKRAAESIYFDYKRIHGVKIKVVRIFNTYGPNMNVKDGRVVSNFITQALTNKDIEIYGDGTQTRSFCYIDDLIDGLIRMMATNDDITGPVNLGNPTEFTINELCNLVIKCTGSKSKICYLPLPEDDPTQRKPDISLAKKLLSWNPKVPLEEGLNLTIDYFKKVLRNCL